MRDHRYKQRGVLGPLARSRLRDGVRCGFSRRLRCDGSNALAAGPRAEPHYGPGRPRWASFIVSSAAAIGVIGFRPSRSVSEKIDCNIAILKYGIKLLMNPADQLYPRYTSVRITSDRDPLFVQRMILPRTAETIMGRFSRKLAP